MSDTPEASSTTKNRSGSVLLGAMPLASGTAAGSATLDWGSA